MKACLKPGGKLVTWDPLCHNPVINVYRKMASQVRTEDEHPLSVRDIKTFQKHFVDVKTGFFWFTTLWIFLRFYLIERVHPNQDRYWKKIIREHQRLAPIHQRYERVDRFLLSALPFLKRYCWNMAVCATKDRMASIDSSDEILTRRSWLNWPILFGVVLVSVGFTWMILAQSFVNGRLAALPVFDDSSYLYDAAKRCETLARSGWSGLAWELKEHPPHSPYSSFMAFVSFKLFGRHDWSPYISNGIIVLVATAYACRMMSSMPRLGPFLAVSMMLTVPVMAWSVHEFRPDLACGLYTAILLVEIVITPPQRKTWLYSIVLGLLFGLCLLTKPTVFPVTGLLTGSAMVIFAAPESGGSVASRNLRSSLSFMHHHWSDWLGGMGSIHDRRL